MLTLNANNDYIEDKGDHYYISSLIVNDDLTIDLDKRLHVGENLFVAGSVIEGEVVVDGAVLIKGSASMTGIQGNSVTIDTANIKGNIIANEFIQLGRASVQGSLISTGKIHLLSDVSVEENVSARDLLVAKANLYVGGSVAAGTMIDIHGRFLCDGEVRFVGKTIETYGRVSGDFYTMVVADDILLFIEKNIVTTIIESMDEYEAEIDQLEVVDEGSKAYEFKKRKDWIRLVPNPIRKRSEA